MKPQIILKPLKYEKHEYFIFNFIFKLYRNE